MLDRLMGTETEYAVHHAVEPGVTPSFDDHEAVFEALRRALARRVPLSEGRGLRAKMQHRVFTAYGGCLYYEHQPQDAGKGLIEGATPECRGPGALLRYQRAQDRLLAEAAREVSDRLPSGEHLSLRKNARDAHGHVYGPQESYEVALAEGPALLAWRLGILALVPLVVLGAVGLWAVTLVTLLAVLGAALTAVIVVAVLAVLGVLDADDLDALPSRWFGAWESRLGVLAEGAAHVFLGPAFVGLVALVRGLAWRRHRRALLGFLASRCVVTGAGSLEPDGSFVLSEKVSGIRRVTRWTVAASDRAIFEVGHLMKALGGPAWLDWGGPLALLQPRQRLQLGLSDANLCDVAEYLKLGTTALILDLVEADALDDVPVPADPVAAARAISADPTLSVAVPLRGGGTLTGLALQRAYQQRAAAHLAASDVAHLEATDLVRRWGEVLDALEADRTTLVGVLDWVTKEALLDRAADEDPATRKRIDLGYHDLGEGYFAWLHDEGLTERLLDDDEVHRAMHTPPEDSPAGLRGRLVQRAARVDWRRAEVGGRVIRLDGRRRRRDRD